MRRRQRPFYAGVFAVIVVALVVAAAVTFSAMRTGETVRTATAAALPVEAGDGFSVRDVDRIRPAPTEYARFEEEGRAWRRAAVAGMEVVATRDAAGTVWRPSAEQLLDDSVYILVGQNRRADAAMLLREWLRTHPRDAARHVTVARLLGEMGRPDDAFEHYTLALRAWPADRTIRAEYAAALLAAGRYTEAADAFRWLAESDDRDEAARLGLARALAWGGRPADAEPLLARLGESHPGDTTIRALLRGVRATITPTSETASAWVAGDPEHRPYVLALARAYAVEGRHADASRRYDELLEDSASVALLSEAAGVRAAGGDSIGTAALLGRAIAAVPDDEALRDRYAQALAWSGDRRGAIAEYTTLLASRESAALRLRRGQLRLLVGDENGAIADLRRSAELEPSYDAYATLGDLYRWRGDTREARNAYEAALALRSGDDRVLAGLALVRAAERAALAQSLDAGEDAGWNVTGSFAEDNAGFLLLRTRLAHGFAMGRSTIASVSAEQRRISQRSATERERFVAGYTVGGAVEHFIRGWQLSAGGGIARHALVPDMGYGHAAVSAPLGPARLSLRASTGPAYTELWSIWTLVRITEEAELVEPLTMRSFAATATMPVGSARVAVTAGRMWLGDGNDRTTAGISVAQPVTQSLRLIYSGGLLGYEGAGSTYWDPEQYVTHAVGVEYAVPITSRVTVAARALGGVARATERFPLVPGIQAPRADWVPHFSGGIDATYRLPGWEITASGGYGRGAPRASGQPGYESLNGTLRVRAAWP